MNVATDVGYFKRAHTQMKIVKKQQVNLLNCFLGNKLHIKGESCSFNFVSTQSYDYIILVEVNTALFPELCNKLQFAQKGGIPLVRQKKDINPLQLHFFDGREEAISF